MRRRHFEALRPICPRCRLEHDREVPLELAGVEREKGGTVLDGVLHCSDPACFLEYPIIDGIPLLLPDIRSYISENLFHLNARDDLSETAEGLIGDGAGPGTPFDATRQHLSTYAWDHYGDLDPQEPTGDGESGAHAPGAAVRCLESGLGLIEQRANGPVIDLGCSVGRTTFEMAEGNEELVVGIDVNFSMLRLAHRVLRDGVVRYPRRRVGIVYDRREFSARFDGSDRVDFWACDALALPFAKGTFALAVAINALDCVASPRGFLESLRLVLRDGGSALLTTPYDWMVGVTPVDGWIGGHSQRGPDRGASEPFLKALLTPGAHPQSVEGLRITGELADIPWHARLHDRSTVSYRVHLVAAQARASGC